jgi:eukaryotic-like serine/threonine-protein kinase
LAPINKLRWQVVSPLLDQLLDTDPDERGASLDQIRLGDHLLAGELEAWLAHAPVANRDAFLTGSVLPADAGLEGETIGGYTLESLIGRGGMGCVWRARRSDGMYEGVAAIKLLDPASTRRAGVERLRRECSILARLAHPHIVRLLDAGVAERGQPYLVLEYLQGAPIDHWCDSRALSVDARVRLFIDVLGAVAHAHDEQIVHQDLKPSNILVTNDGHVKLLDFGIATLLDGAEKSVPASESTLPSARAFTPDFAAPEQVQRLEVTAAADVYALGVLLYLLLSGQHPTAPIGGTAAERLQAVVEAEPLPMSVAVLRGAAESSDRAGLLRNGLDAVVARALKKSAAERYATPVAMAEDLRRWLRRAGSARHPASAGSVPYSSL